MAFDLQLGTGGLAAAPARRERVLRAALDVATSPLPVIAFASLLLRAFRGRHVVARRNAPEAVVGGPVLA